MDDTPRTDTGWVDLLNRYGLKFTWTANVPYYSGSNAKELIGRIGAAGHEVCDHTPLHTTLYAPVPSQYMHMFEPYLKNGIGFTDSDTYHGVACTRLFFEHEVDVNFADYPYQADKKFQLKKDVGYITGDFTAMYPDHALVYIDNTQGEKVGWAFLNRNDTAIFLNAKPQADEDITLYYLNHTAVIQHFALTENATYCLLLAGQCWFDYWGLPRPKTWNQPGGYMPFLNRRYLRTALRRLGMVGGIADQTASDGAQPTYCYATPYPLVSYRWDGWFDYADGTDEYLERLKGAIADNVAKRSIRTYGGHFLYNRFPGETNEEKRQSWLAWFDRLFAWIAEQGIDCLTVEEMLLALEHASTNRFANVFPELYMDRANRGKPDGYTISNPNVKWTTGGRPESRDYALKIHGNGNVFTVESLGAIEKGENELTLWVKADRKAEITVKTERGLSVEAWNPEEYAATRDVFQLKKPNLWQKLVVPLTIPHDMNYITVTLEVAGNEGSTLSVSGISLRGK